MSASIPSTWLELSLGDVVDYGKTKKIEPDQIEDNFWVLELEDIEKDTSYLLQKLTYAERKSKSTKNLFKKGDVLYGKLRPYLNKVLIADQDGCCTTEIIPLESSGILDNRYLFYWLKHPTFLKYVADVSHGINMPRLGTDAGKAAPFVLAPYNEQKRIADKLDGLLAAVDSCRTRLDKVPALIKRFRQSVLAAATSGTLTEDWRTANDFKQKHSHLDSSADGLPESWEESTMGSVVSDLRYGTSKKCDYAKKGFGVLRIPNIGDRLKIDLTDLKYANFEKSERGKLALEEGDILIIRSNGSLDLVGKCAIVSNASANIGLLFAGYLIRLRCDRNIVNPKYAAFSLISPKLRQIIERTAKSTSGVNNINSEELRSLPINLPSILEQQEIIRRVEALFAIADKIETRLAVACTRIDQFTPSILAQAFRGELVEQDQNDEPASALLERATKKAA